VGTPSEGFDTVWFTKTCCARLEKQRENSMAVIRESFFMVVVFRVIQIYECQMKNYNINKSFTK